jgi:hypothetical protein
MEINTKLNKHSEEKDLKNSEKKLDKLTIWLLLITLLTQFVSFKQLYEYEPDKKIFCGLRNLPQGYGRYGNRYECLKRGFGAGINRNERKYPFRKWGYIFIIILLGISIYNYYKSKYF